jgi:hypothetical protein
MYKRLGLSPEEVCEIGKWKNHWCFHHPVFKFWGQPKGKKKQIQLPFSAQCLI